MTTLEKPDFRALNTRLKQLETLSDVVSLMFETEPISIDSLAEPEAAHNFRLNAFQRLQQLTEKDPVAAESIILDYLLPNCLVAEPSAQPERPLFGHRYRAVLDKWVNQYSAPDRNVLRNKVLIKTRASLVEPSLEPALWTISAIGYRDSKTWDTLWSITQKRDDTIGDIALSVLTILGVPSELRTQLVDEIHKRSARRQNRHLLGAIWRILDPGSLNIIQDHWMSVGALAIHDSQLSMALHVLAAIARANPEDEELLESVWRRIETQCEHYPEQTVGIVLLSSAIAPVCNNPDVIPTFLRWLAGHIGESQIGPNQRYLIYHRLGECSQPKQLIGWQAEPKSEVIEILKQDALSDTKQVGRYTSTEAFMKEMAWDSLFRLGHKDCLSWFESAFVSETNELIRKQLCEQIACFRLETLPQAIINLIVEPYDCTDDEITDWASRMGAIRVARSTASESAFNALINFGFRYKGKVLQQSADALAEVALSLHKNGVEVLGPLLDKAVQGKASWQRTCAIGVLEMLASQAVLPTGTAAALVPLLDDVSLDQYTHSLIVSILGYVQDSSVFQEVLARIEEWALTAQDWIGMRSIETLARRGPLINNEPILVQKLGLIRQDNDWFLAANSEIQPTNWAGYVLGILYRQNSDLFSLAVADYLRTQAWSIVAPLVQLLIEQHQDGYQHRLPVNIREALFSRMISRTTNIRAEPDILRTLGTLVPDELVQHLVAPMWQQWLPEARSTLADVLGQSKYQNKANVTGATSILLYLTRDGQFSVRRSAYRALASISAETFKNLLASLSYSESVELREHAAEAIIWLELNKASEKIYLETSGRLLSDSEPTVREIMERSISERWRRLWADNYLAILLHESTDLHDSVLSKWRYGKALAKIGDDNTLRSLREFIAMTPLPPNVKFWIEQIHQELAQQWRATTQKWPDPWVFFKGALEVATGNLRTLDKVFGNLNFLLWHDPALNPSDKASWGGSVYIEGMIMLGLPPPDELELELEDGRKGIVIESGYADNLLVFLGQGHFPVKP